MLDSVNQDIKEYYSNLIYDDKSVASLGEPIVFIPSESEFTFHNFSFINKSQEERSHLSTNEVLPIRVVHPFQNPPFDNSNNGFLVLHENHIVLFNLEGGLTIFQYFDNLGLSLSANEDAIILSLTRGDARGNFFNNGASDDKFVAPGIYTLNIALHKEYGEEANQILNHRRMQIQISKTGFIKIAKMVDENLDYLVNIGEEIESGNWKLRFLDKEYVESIVQEYKDEYPEIEAFYAFELLEFYKLKHSFDNNGLIKLNSMDLTPTQDEKRIDENGKILIFMGLDPSMAIWIATNEGLIFKSVTFEKLFNWHQIRAFFVIDLSPVPPITYKRLSLLTLENGEFSWYQLADDITGFYPATALAELLRILQYNLAQGTINMGTLRKG